MRECLACDERQAGEKRTKLLSDMSMMKPSELWKMAVDDRVRSLLKGESSQKGKVKGEGNGKNNMFTPRSCAAFTKTTMMDPCLKIRLNK